MKTNTRTSEVFLKLLAHRERVRSKPPRWWQKRRHAETTGRDSRFSFRRF